MAKKFKTTTRKFFVLDTATKVANMCNTPDTAAYLVLHINYEDVSGVIDGRCRWVQGLKGLVDFLGLVQEKYFVHEIRAIHCL